MVGPGLTTTTFRSCLDIRYNFCVSTKPRSNPLRRSRRNDLMSASSAVTPKECRQPTLPSNRDDPPIRYADRIRLATKPIGVRSKLLDLLIPKTIAVVEMDVLKPAF
jgi:hypothetical protein